MLHPLVHVRNSARRVLVIDDSLEAAELLARMLEALGHAAAFVINPFDALDAVEGMRPEVVFIDIDMPKLDGWQLARLLRRRFEDEPLRLVALAGLDQPADRLRSRRAGFDAHLVKPANAKAIDDAVRGLHELIQAFP